jgi:hypothetical protein
MSPRYLAVANGHVAARRVAADALLVAGGLIVSVSLSLTVLRMISLKPNLFPIFLVGALLGGFLLARPQWIVPSVMAVVLIFAGRQSIAGLPSLVLIGSGVLLCFGIRQITARLDLTREVLVVIGLIGLALIGTGLVSPDGPEIRLIQLKGLTFLFLFALALKSVKDVDRVATALGVVAVFLGLGGVAASLGHPTTLFPLQAPKFAGQEFVEHRVTGPFGDPNFFGLGLASLMPFAMYLVAAAGRRRYLGIAAMLLLIGGILATGSRGALIAVVFAIVACAIYMPARAVRVMVALVVVGGLAALPVFAPQTQEAQKRDVVGRQTAALVGLSMFEDHLLTGVGPDRYPAHFRHYSRLIGNEARLVLEPHSLPVQIASEQGLVGVLAWLAAAVAILRYAIMRGVWRHLLGRAILFSLATYMVASLFLHGGLLEILWMLIGIFFAFAGALPASGRGDDEQLAPARAIGRRRLKLAAASAMALMILAVGVIYAAAGPTATYKSSAEIVLTPTPELVQRQLDTFQLSGISGTYVELLSSQDLVRRAGNPPVEVSATAIPDTRAITIVAEGTDREVVQPALAAVLRAAQVEGPNLRDDWHIHVLGNPTAPGSGKTSAKMVLLGALLLAAFGALAIWSLMRPVRRASRSRRSESVPPTATALAAQGYPPSR